MSLSLVICERFKEISQNVKDYTKDIISKYKLDAKIVLVTEDPMDIIKYSSRRSEFPNINTYVLCVHKDSYLKSFQTARVIRHNDPQSFIIFISDTYVFCKEALRHNIEAYDYLNTPVVYDELKECLMSLNKCYTNHIQYISDCNSICIKAGSSSFKIAINEIIYVESYDQKLQIHTCEKTFECFGYLKDIDKELNKCEKLFYRCHRSFLINLNHIKELNNKEMYVEMSNNQKCLFSRQKKKEIKELLNIKQLAPRTKE